MCDWFLKFYTLHEKCPYSDFFWSVFSHIQHEYRKIQTRKTPNTDAFHLVIIGNLCLLYLLNES